MKNSYDVQKIRNDFPILSQKIHGQPLVYLDSASSAQKPESVIHAISDLYRNQYANVHRGLHSLSNSSTELYENVRIKLAKFFNVQNPNDIIYIRSASEGINLVATAWARKHLKADDEIILSTLEHHANIVPWHFLRQELGVKLIWVDPEADGNLSAQSILNAITEKTKLIAITHISNVTGTIVDVKAICEGAKSHNIPVLVDGSQAAPHQPVHIEDINCDFYIVTGHKIYGPNASGALYMKPERAEESDPYQGGGAMIKDVTKDTVTYLDSPHKFEVGTPAIAPMIGLGAALDYLTHIGMSEIHNYEQHLTSYTSEKLSEIDELKLYGNLSQKAGIFSFSLDGVHSHDLSTILDRYGIAVRAGHHCAYPLMNFFKTAGTCRASLSMFNTRDEIDHLAESLKKAHKLLTR